MPTLRPGTSVWVSATNCRSRTTAAVVQILGRRLGGHQVNAPVGEGDVHLLLGFVAGVEQRGDARATAACRGGAGWRWPG